MLKIRPLNRDSLSDEDAPTIRKEAQEEIALDLYNKALRLQCNGKLEESEIIFQQLIKENIPQLESQGGLPKTMSTLKYSCYVNLGTNSKVNGDIKLALDYYLLASELDKSDVTLWYKIGMLALKSDKFRQAIYAFSQGLECNEAHWPCLHQLILLLYGIQDTIACLTYITKALILNPDYTRGLVLRRKIYELNSATREYYRLFNPDYVLEPDLDVTVDDTAEKNCMEDAEKLCERINEVERSLGPKPLSIVALPTPLEEFTWLALGRTLTDLHKYISDNNMSHFCLVDLNKSMSHRGVSPGPTVVVESSKPIEMLPETKVLMMEVEEKMENDLNVERRMSVTSENNGDANMDSGVENINSSQAEDNDEMEDTEDQEENPEQKTNKKKATKRRRDLLLDLQVWGWHSKRKTSKKGKSEKDVTVEDALKRIIPPHLLPNGLQLKKCNSNENSMNTVDIYKMFTEEQATVTCLSPIRSPEMHKEKEQYFGSQKEKDDVLKFWTKQWVCRDAVSLIEEFVFVLASLWNFKWPLKLVNIYIDAYKMYREHFDHPQLYGKLISMEELKKDALATLLHGELFFYQATIETGSEENIYSNSLGHLQTLSAWEEKWGSDYTLFFLRVHWLRAHIFRKASDNCLAIRSLQLVQEVILDQEAITGKKFRLFFPNCRKYSFVTLEITKKLLNHLEMIESLSHLEQLFNSSRYSEVSDILETTFMCIGNPPASGRMGRPAQLGMLIDSLWYINRERCFIWTEKCLNEAVGHFVKPLKDRDKWPLVLDKCLLVLYEIIKEETVSIVDVLLEDQKCQIVENICRILCFQINTENAASIPLGSVTPWIVLHHLLLREEHREQARRVVKHVRKRKKDNFGVSTEDCDDGNEKELPPSISILFSAHEFLGQKGWCLTSQGELLHFMIDTILDRLDTPIFEPLRDRIDIHLEQAFFCLYQHPSKKNKISRHLADHNVNPLPLRWERAQQLYDFFCPDALPEFDSYKSISITSDFEQLLQRIIVLVPTEYDPQPITSKISEFVFGSTSELPTPIDFPNKIRAAYYLLGDYYFKQNEFGRSVKYFFLDLCINPLRLDSWADLALGYASQLESKLNHCERFKNDNEFLEKAKSAQVCFKQSMKLSPDHVTLWIEFGAFEYMAHAFCSRLLKYESDTFSMEKFEVLESQKENYLDSAGNNFTKALDLYQPEQTEADERWLHHYMLGKVAEKRRKEPVDYLQHYLTAAALLNENNATYPEKINYHNPQHLSVEALEIHYRLHASILKYLELHEGKNILSSVGKMFKKCLDTTKLYETQTKFAESKKSEKTNKDELSEVAKCVQDLLDQVERKEKEMEGGDDNDVIVLDDAEVEKASAKTDTPEGAESQIKVRNVQDLMDSLMRETMSKMRSPVDTDSDATNVEEVVKVVEIAEETKAKESAKDEGVMIVENYKKDEDVRKSVDDTTTASSTSSDSSSSDSDSDDSSSSTSTSSDISSTYLSDSEVYSLVDRCIAGLEQCVIRFPQNYKALYRLVHLYFHYKARKDVWKCKQLLLSEYKCKNGSIVTGLFSEHKANNFFNGVWRIPSSEIDRPGSLSAHMNRCVTILLQVLRHNHDHKLLLDVCLQLKRAPDADKIYIKHADREQLSEQALSLCIQALKAQIKNVNSINGLQKLLLDVFRGFQRIQKHISQKETIFSNMLTEVYKKFMQGKLPENVNILDLAIKFCQQHKAAEKLKQQQQLKQNVVQPQSAPIISTTPVVLPPPTSATLPSQSQPLKRPTLGRPRGRPPGPKQPSLQRPNIRGRALSSNNPLAWQNMMYDPSAMNYLVKYQEQLLLSQINQMKFGQFAHRNTSPSSLLATNQLAQSLAQAWNNPLTVNQNLNRSNLDLFKKLMEQPGSSGSKHLPTSTWCAADVTKQMNAKKVSKVVTKNPAAVDGSKPLYTMAGFSNNKNLPSASFSYKTQDAGKAKLLEQEKKSAQLKQVGQDEYAKATNILNGRPSITITPVTQTKPALNVGKTLQEILADKQKQLGINVGDGKLKEKGKSQQKTNFHTPPSSIAHVNLPTFPLDSGVSISQLPRQSTTSSATQVVRDVGNKKIATKKQKTSLSHIEDGKNLILPPNMPISVSVIKKTIERKDSSDDDVIIIE